MPTDSHAIPLPLCTLRLILKHSTHAHHACAHRLAHVNFLVAHLFDIPVCTSTPFLVQSSSTGTLTCSTKQTGHTGKLGSSPPPTAADSQVVPAPGAWRAPCGLLSACPSARGSAVVDDAFDGGCICCARSERAPIIWKAEIRNTIYSAALWKQFEPCTTPFSGSLRQPGR